MKRSLIFICALTYSYVSISQTSLFSIRTITAGVELASIDDEETIGEAISFLKKAKIRYESEGYTVQTLRISTQHFYELAQHGDIKYALKSLREIDEILLRENITMAIGSLLPPNEYDQNVSEWAENLTSGTKNISFSIEIASAESGIFENSIKAAAEIAVALSKNNGGEDNFRFTASSNCPADIPFFPAAYHRGARSFALGFESPNLLKHVFEKSDWNDAAENLKTELEIQYKPLENIAVKIALENKWKYDGIDTSPAPGLDASIGRAIEELTGRPFGDPSTLRACSLITGVLKNLDLKTCGYSGLMLPVIEDKILTQRAIENRFSLEEILLYSAVSGTGLDVIPIPGNTSVKTLEGLYADVAALSLKYDHKALSARLFLIPGKKAGDPVNFENPYLTGSKVMKVN